MELQEFLPSRYLPNSEPSKRGSDACLSLYVFCVMEDEGWLACESESLVEALSLSLVEIWIASFDLLASTEDMWSLLVMYMKWFSQLPGNLNCQVFLGYNRGLVKLVSCVEYEAKDLQMQEFCVPHTGEAGVILQPHVLQALLYNANYISTNEDKTPNKTPIFTFL